MKKRRRRKDYSITNNFGRYIILRPKESMPPERIELPTVTYKVTVIAILL